MTPKNTPRDDVDALIDTYLNTEASETGADPDQQLVQRLGHYYQLPEGHDLALKRVQAHLEGAQNPLAEGEARLADSPGQLKAFAPNVTHLETRSRFSRGLSLLAAVLLVALLLGGALAVLRQAQSQPASAVHVHKVPQTPQSQPAWLYALDGQVWSQPDHISLTQIDPNSGQARWQSALNYENEGSGHGGFCFTPPTTLGDRIYFESSDTHGTTIYALNVTSGKLSWKALVGGTCEKLVIANGVVFTAQSTPGNDRVLAFNVRTGQQVWRQDYPGSGKDYIDNFEVIGVNQGILYLDNLLLAQQKSALLAINTQTGAKIWQQDIPRVANVTSSTIVGNVLYLAGEPVLMNTPQTPSSLIAFDLAARKQLWSQSFTGSAYQLIVKNQSIYISTLNKDQQGEMAAGSVYVLNASTGAIVWQRHPGQEIMDMQVANGEMYLALADLGRAVYSHSSKDKNGKTKIIVDGPPWHLQALKASNGQPDWQRTMPASVDSGLLIYHAHLYLTDVTNDAIDVLDISNGQQIKTLPFPANANGLVALA